MKTVFIDETAIMPHEYVAHLESLLGNGWRLNFDGPDGALTGASNGRESVAIVLVQAKTRKAISLHEEDMVDGQAMTVASNTKIVAGVAAALAAAATAALIANALLGGG